MLYGPDEPSISKTILVSEWIAAHSVPEVCGRREETETGPQEKQMPRKSPSILYLVRLRSNTLIGGAARHGLGSISRVNAESPVATSDDDFIVLFASLGQR